MKTGELYKSSAWFYVIDQDAWYKTDVIGKPYYKEDDELTEEEANKLGYFRGKRRGYNENRS